MAVVPTFTPGTALTQAALLSLLNPPQAGAGQNTTTQSFANGALTVVTLDSLEYDTDATSWSLANPTRLYVNTPGTWRFIATMTWAASTTGLRILDLRKNAAGSSGSGVRLGYQTENSFGGGQPAILQITVVVPGLAAGDYVEVFGMQNSGGALSTTVTANGSTGIRSKWEGTT